MNMSIQELLENSNDKLSILTDNKLLIQNGIYYDNYDDLFKKYLTDQEKIAMLNSPSVFEYRGKIRAALIDSVENEDLRLNLLNNISLISSLDDNSKENIINNFSLKYKSVIIQNQDFIDANKLNNYLITNIVKTLDKKDKLSILNNEDFLKRNKINVYNIEPIISSFDNQNIIDILNDKQLINEKLNLDEYNISAIISKLSSEDLKEKFINYYKVKDEYKAIIVSTYSDESKIKFLKSNKNIAIDDEFDILKNLSPKYLADLIKNNREFLEDRDIKPFMITRKFNLENQEEFLKYLEQINLSTNDKKCIIASLGNACKESVDISKYPKEYAFAFSTKMNYSKNLEVDLNEDPNNYFGLDELIKINPTYFTSEQKEQFKKLCVVCPNLKIVNTIGNTIARANPYSKDTAPASFSSYNQGYVSTVDEYNNAEKWVDSVIEGINPEYSPIQKLAIIDRAIGKKITYSPDEGSEIYDSSASRSLWKIIDSGAGVCNGIATVEQYMLQKVGIQSQVVSGHQHAFLKVIDLDIPTQDGKIIKGNTVVDPTWNLCENRYDGKPQCFCTTYDGIRKFDVNSKGEDGHYHQNDKDLLDASIGLDSQSLIDLYKSIGVTDEKGNFPRKKLYEQAEKIKEINKDNPDFTVACQLELVSKYLPELANCPYETMNVIESIFIKNDIPDIDRYVVNRVYNKNDKEKKPELFIYTNNSMEQKDIFYVINKNSGKFTSMSKEDFIKQYDCYNTDLENNDGLRFWEQKDSKEMIQKTSDSSEEAMEK